MMQNMLPPRLFLAAVATIPATSISNATAIPTPPLVQPSFANASPTVAAQDWNKTTIVSTMLMIPMTNFAVFMLLPPFFYLFFTQITSHKKEGKLILDRLLEPHIWII